MTKITQFSEEVVTALVTGILKGVAFARNVEITDDQIKEIADGSVKQLTPLITAYIEKGIGKDEKYLPESEDKELSYFSATTIYRRNKMRREIRERFGITPAVPTKK